MILLIFTRGRPVTLMEIFGRHPSKIKRINKVSSPHPMIVGTNKNSFLRDKKPKENTFFNLPI